MQFPDITVLSRRLTPGAQPGTECSLSQFWRADPRPGVTAHQAARRGGGGAGPVVTGAGGVGAVQHPHLVRPGDDVVVVAERLLDLAALVGQVHHGLSGARRARPPQQARLVHGDEPPVLVVPGPGADAVDGVNRLTVRALDGAQERAPGLATGAHLGGDVLADLVGAGQAAQVAAEAVLVARLLAHGLDAGDEEAERHPARVAARLGRGGPVPGTAAAAGTAGAAAGPGRAAGAGRSATAAAAGAAATAARAATAASGVGATRAAATAGRATRGAAAAAGAT